MTLKPMPGPSGGLMPKHLGLRPCTYNPPQWWDLGHPKVEEAKRLCRTQCPEKLFRECEAGPQVYSMVKAGVLFDDRGNPVPEPCDCGECRRCKGVVADHHMIIAACRAAGVPFRDIAARIGFSEDATRVYWHSRGKHKQGGVANGTGAA